MPKTWTILLSKYTAFCRKFSEEIISCYRLLIQISNSHYVLSLSNDLKVNNLSRCSSDSDATPHLSLIQPNIK